MLGLKYTPDAPHGKRWTYVDEDGTETPGLSQTDAAALLRAAGCTFRAADFAVAQAKLRALQAGLEVRE